MVKICRNCHYWEHEARGPMKLCTNPLLSDNGANCLNADSTPRTGGYFSCMHWTLHTVAIEPAEAEADTPQKPKMILVKRRKEA